MIKMITTTTAAILVMATAATASPKSCTVKTDTNGVQIIKKGCVAFVGASGANGQDGASGPQGVRGQTGDSGSDGVDGASGPQGVRGQTGDSGSDGVDGVTPLGSLSFAAASASFYGDGMGFGLSGSTYSSLEGSIIFGFNFDNDWRVVAGITTDFNGKTAGSIGVGVSF